MVGIPPKVLLAFMVDPRFKCLPKIPAVDRCRLWDMLLHELVASIGHREEVAAKAAATASASALVRDIVDVSDDDDAPETAAGSSLPAVAAAAAAVPAAAASGSIDWISELGAGDEAAPAGPIGGAGTAGAETLAQAMARRTTAAEHEIRLYQGMERLLHSPPGVVGDPLEWWRGAAASLPHLARLARKLLCIPATSASSERIFSSAGLTITARRARLTQENASALLFLGGAYEKVKEFDDEERKRKKELKDRNSPAKKQRAK